MAKAYGFSEEFARRVSRVVHRAEGTGPQHPPVPVGQPRGETVYWVKCTHDVATVINTKSYFPAAVQSYDGPTNAFANLPGGTCWLVAPNDLALTEKIYPAWHAGYVYNASGYLPVFLTIDVTGATGPAGGTIEVKEADGTPDVTGVTTLVMDQADGYTVTDTGGGVVNLGIADATASQAGVVSTTTQTFAGIKTFLGNVVIEQNLTLYTGIQNSPVVNDFRLITSTVNNGLYLNICRWSGTGWTNLYGFVLSTSGVNIYSASGAYGVGGTYGISGTATLAKLTAGGANGSLTITGGIITAKTDPT